MAPLRPTINPTRVDDQGLVVVIAEVVAKPKRMRARRHEEAVRSTEATAQEEQRSSTWSTEDAVTESKSRAEKAAFARFSD